MRTSPGESRRVSLKRRSPAIDSLFPSARVQLFQATADGFVASFLDRDGAYYLFLVSARRDGILMPILSALTDLCNADGLTK
uniref:Robl_LC7 domain-containing protein n=1 Tax=Steinernema glaseri TaxID=37863 RepID=A0A1I7YT27_9BILA